MNRSDDPHDVGAASGASADDVVAALAERHAMMPPEHVRADLLARVAAAPRQPVEPLAPLDLYAARVDALRRLFASMQPGEWSSTAHPYDWSVHGLVAHLLVIERYAAFLFGVPGAEPVDAGESRNHLAMGADAIAAELRRSPRDTADEWCRVSASIVDHVRATAPAPDTRIAMHGWPFTVASALVARAFEIWTHTDDIRRATGRPLDVPAASELRTMSSLSVRALPELLRFAVPDRSLAPTRIVLTGPGGGTFDIGGHEERAATLVADVVDYCRVAARRLDPGELAGTRTGDLALVGSLLEASRAFAV